MLMRYLNNVRMVDRTWTPDDLSRFVDAGSVGFWALDAMKDAVAINAPVHPAGQKRDTRGGCKDPDDIPRDNDQVIPSMRMHPVNLTGCIFLPDRKHFSFFLPLRVVHYTVQFYREVFFYAGKLYYLPG